MMLLAGQILGERYRVERLLGSGGMADVYLVSDLRLPKQSAVKVLRTEATDPELQRRFRREADILATLRHSHIVDVSDRGVTNEGQPYLVMELLEGEDLSRVLLRAGPLRLPVALHICAQVGEALIAAHKLGIVHRDLKPANVFLCQDGAFPNFVKVLDFGIAKIAQPDSAALTGVTTIMGTPGYMAPEQAMGAQDKVDHRADQFSLAALVYEMIAGHPPFHQYGQPMGAILEQALYNDPKPLPMEHVNRAVSKALAKRPEDRFPDIQTFLANVGATTRTVYTQGLPADLNRPDSHQPGELVARKRRLRWVFPIVAAAGVLLTITGVLVYKATAATPARSAVAALGQPVSVQAAQASGLVTASHPLPGLEDDPEPEVDSAQTDDTPAPPSAPPTPVAVGSVVIPPSKARRAEPATRSGDRARSASSVVARGFQITLTGASPDLARRAEQEQKVRGCSEKYLGTIPGLPPSFTIGLVRVSHQLLLSPGRGQNDIDEAGFLYCLERSFQRGEELPAQVKILVTRNK